MDYYLVSTPLHLYMSCALALRRHEHMAQLVFIDQYPKQANMFLHALSRWKNSPFQKINVFLGRDSTGLNKLRVRNTIFRKLRKLIDDQPAKNIFVGNDRRIEFQYMMQYCAKKNLQTKGIYFDEGLFTYIGREASDRWQERVVDSLVKKLFYGLWWHTPRTIGGSKWIDEIYVAFPDLIHQYLKEKKVSKLSESFFQHPKLLEFSQLLLQEKNINNSEVRQYSVIVTLPESTDMKQIPNYQESIHNLVETLFMKEVKVAIKYHPSAQGEDVLGVCKKFPVQLLPDNIPFEILLPILDAKATIIGDMSSTLLTTKMLRPNINVIGFTMSQSKYYEKFKKFFASIGITFLTLSNIQDSIL